MIKWIIKTALRVAFVLFVALSVFFLWQFKRDEKLAHCYAIPMERLKTLNWRETINETLDKGEKLMETGKEVASNAAQIASSAGEMKENLETLGEL
ncbi:hypothetical protein FWH30_02945 [Microgenomates group bacterium]|nr:hypothetical protein [Microgenomates group bacterium]